MTRGALLLSLSLTACSAPSATTGGAGTGGSGASNNEGGEAPVCCPLEIPSQWDGPATFYLGDQAPPQCPSPWLEPGPTGGTKVASTTDCGCTCADPIDGLCPTPGWVAMYDDAICYHAVGAFTPWTTCTSSSGAPFVMTAKADPVIPAGGTCDAVSEHVFMPPVWTTKASLCVGTPQDDCHAEYCDAGANGYAKHCIFRPSVFSCPDERYTERTIIYRDVSDTRNCSDCSCGEPTGATCTATMELWTEPDCTGELAQIPSDQSCTATGLSSNTQGYRLELNGPNGGECSPNGGEPSGTVEPIEPMTVCCEPG